MIFDMKIDDASIAKRIHHQWKPDILFIENEKNIKFVQMNPHLITVKTAGSNYYLFLTKVNDVNNSLMATF